MSTVVVRDPQNILTNSHPGAKIELVKLPTGDFVVSDSGKTKEDILKEKYPNLMGQGIIISDAAKKYGVNRTIIFRWVYKGYIHIIEPEPVMLVDEADVNYCVDIYKEKVSRGVGHHGTPLLDKDGLPYELKHPDLAKKRRNN